MRRTLAQDCPRPTTKRVLFVPSRCVLRHRLPCGKNNHVMITSSIVAAAALSLLCVACGGKKEPSNGAVVADKAAGALPNGRVVDTTLLGGQPSDAGYRSLAGSGYKTVIDLRPAAETGAKKNADLVAAAGMKYINIPIAGPAGLTRESVAKFSESLAKSEDKIVVHCASGNRVGALYGLKAHWLDGATPEQALAIAKEAGMTGLEDVVTELLGLER